MNCGNTLNNHLLFSFNTWQNHTYVLLYETPLLYIQTTDSDITSSFGTESKSTQKRTTRTLKNERENEEINRERKIDFICV